MKISRQLRRKITRNGYVNEDIKAIYQATIDYTLSGYDAVIALTLRDELGFGEKRTKRFLKRLREQFDSIQQGVVSLEEIREQVKKEVNIDLQKELVEDN